MMYHPKFEEYIRPFILFTYTTCLNDMRNTFVLYASACMAINLIIIIMKEKELTKIRHSRELQ